MPWTSDPGNKYDKKLIYKRKIVRFENVEKKIFGNSTKNKNCIRIKIIVVFYVVPA